MSQAPSGPAAPWTADLGDGTYRNPVLNADWSDPDVVRAGDDFYLTASSFGRAPGLPVLHSRDLVNWSLIGHALDRLEPEDTFAVPRHDHGVWAPSFRRYGGRFWIFWGDPDHGIQQVSAEDPRGPWTRPVMVKEGKGLIDPCPLWDENGDAYLVHGWAKSRSGVKNRLTGHRMSPDGRELLDEGRIVVDGDLLPGWFTLEGPKLYRHDGWFWIFAPAGGVETGWQGAFRSRGFFGPYEARTVLAQGRTEVNGPHQGGWVRTAVGEDWFLHFQQRGPYGRVVHLQPMAWDDDGWPVIGDGGEPVAAHRKPKTAASVQETQPVEAPAVNDDFPGGRFGRQWSWTANPGRGWTVLHGGDGLRLTCRRAAETADLRGLPNVLVQRLPAEEFRVTTGLRLDAEAPGARAGLAVLGDAYSWIGLERGPGGGLRLVHRFAEATATAERDAEHPRAAPSGTARLCVEVSRGARCRFLADTGDGGGWRPSGPVFAARPWNWVGAQLGLFAAAPAGEGPAGTAGFTAFRATPHRTARIPDQQAPGRAST